MDIRVFGIADGKNCLDGVLVMPWGGGGVVCPTLCYWSVLSTTIPLWCVGSARSFCQRQWKSLVRSRERDAVVSLVELLLGRFGIWWDGENPDSPRRRVWTAPHFPWCNWCILFCYRISEFHRKIIYPMQYIASDIKSLAACVCVCARVFWGRISPKRLQIETWYKWPMRIDWSPDLWPHLTLKGQGRDPKMFGVYYLENGWRYRLRYNRTSIGNGTWGIKWSHDRWRQWSVNRDLGMFGLERGSLEKSHGIGQTLCSYGTNIILFIQKCILRLLQFLKCSAKVMYWGFEQRTC